MREAEPPDDEVARRVEFKGALAVVAARYADIDRRYVRTRLAVIAESEDDGATNARPTDRRTFDC